MKKFLLLALLPGLLALIPLGTATASEVGMCYVIGDSCLIISNFCFLDEVDCGDGSTWESQYKWKAGWCKAALYAGIMKGTVDECVKGAVQMLAEPVLISSLNGMTPQRSQYQQSNSGGNKQQSKTGGNGQQSNSGGGNQQGGSGGGNEQTPLILTLTQTETRTETTLTHTSLETLLSLYQQEEQYQQSQQQQSQTQTQSNRGIGYPTCVIGKTFDVGHLNIAHCDTVGQPCKIVATMRGTRCTWGSCQWRYTYKQ